MQLILLFEDAFKEKVEAIYDSKLKGHVSVKPSDFDRDALQLGVIYEMPKSNTFHGALYRAMKNLQKDPHCYDEVDDLGGRDQPPMNHVTLSGRPGIPR